MFRNLCLLLFTFLLLTHELRADTEISIEAPDFPGEEFYLLYHADYLSDYSVLIDQVGADDQGRLVFKIANQSTASFSIAVGGWFAPIYLSDDASYSIRLVKPKKPTALSFQGNELELSFTNLEQNDPNRVMTEFNRDYDRFFGDKALELAVKLGKGDKSVLAEDSTQIARYSFLAAFDSLNDHYSMRMKDITDDYTVQLIKGKLGSLDMELGANRDKVRNEWLVPGAIHENPEQMALFEQLHSLVLGDRDIETDSLNAAISMGNARLALSLLSGYKLCQSDYECGSVLKLISKTAWYNRSMKRKHILSFLDALDETLSGLDVDALAHHQGVFDSLDGRHTGRMQERLAEGSTLAEYFLPDITLVDHTGERVNLSEYGGELLYLSVVNTKSAACQRELLLMEGLYRKFGLKVRFVTIVMDGDPDQLRNYLARNRAQEWQFLIGSGHPILKNALRLKSIPSFYLVMPDGRLKDDYTVKPSEGIHDEFVRLTRGQPEKIKVWD